MLTNAFLLSFSLCLVFLIIGIKYLEALKLGQAIRKLGPKRHYSKKGTPNIGGVFIILSVIITYIIIIILYKVEVDYKLLFMLFMPLLSYGVLGFLDDFLKATQNKNDGLSPTCKLFFQILWATLYFIIFLDYENTNLNIFGYNIDLKWFYGVLICFLFVGSSNAFNLCDGLDGLASGIGIIILIGLAFLLPKINTNVNVTLFVIILIGSLIAFWILNFHPARIFMGDSGSLALGSTICNLFIILKIESLLIIFGFVMIIETLSVIIQVLYFKKTKGKRLFLMTPLHHHFELKGMKEERISIVFWIIQMIMVILGLIIYNLCW